MGQVAINIENKEFPTHKEAEEYIIQKVPELLPLYGHFLRFNITRHCLVEFYLIGNASDDDNDNWND